jgi:cell division transport system permease protein
MLITKIRRMSWSGFLNFCRSPVISLASVITLTATLFVIGALVLSNAFFSAALRDFQAKVDISVSFREEVPETKVLEIKKSLELLPEVAEVVYNSREVELDDFRKRNADNELELQLLEELGNPFGARLNIRAVDPAHYESIVKFLQSDQSASSIDKISYKRDVVEQLVKIVSTAKRIGFASTLLFVFISLVVTFNTISLAIYISREEISLMRLVGASANYIRGPFLVEGVIAGAISALAALVLLYAAAVWLRDTTAGIYGGFNLATYFSSHFALLLAVLLVCGAGLGVLASFMATGKHLKS